MLINKLILVLCLQVMLVNCVPIQLLLPLQYGTQPHGPFFRQMLAASPNPPVALYPQQPVMILLPKTPSVNIETDDRYQNLIEHNTRNNLKSNTGYVDEDSEAIVINAEENHIEKDARKEVLLRKDGKQIIGGIISYIPFLPIEINVPDTISWIIDFITGNRNPFRPQVQNPEDTNVKRISNKGPMMPIMVMPMNGDILPLFE